MTIFDTLTKNDASNRLNIIIIVIIRSISIEIDTSLALFQKLFFIGHIDFFFLKRGPPYWRKLTTDVTDFEKQTAEDNFYLLCNFEENRSKIATVRVPRRKVHNGHHDVIDLKISKSEKNEPRKYLSDHL